mgnify:CR=1 FL=1|jgi:hypothetical protein
MTRYAPFRILCMAGSFSTAPLLAQVDVPPDGLRVSPTIRALYDDNMLRQNDALIAGDKDDLRTTPSLDVTYRHQFGLHQLTVVGSVGYDFHQRFEFLDRERISMVADADLSVSGYCRARPRARLNFAQSNLSDQGVIQGNSQRTQDYNLTLACERPQGFYPVVTAGYLTTMNSADVRRRFDINTKTASVGLGYAVESIGALEISFDYQSFRRPHLDDANVSLRDGADNYTVAALFRRNVAPRLSWRAGITYIKTKPRSEGIGSFSGMGFQGQANWRPSPRLSVIWDVDRSSRNQSNSGATYIIQTDYALRLNMNVGARSNLTAGATLNKRRFKGELLLDTTEPRRRDTTRGVIAGYRYALRSRLKVGTELRHERRSTSVARYRYHNTSAMLFIGLDL